MDITVIKNEFLTKLEETTNTTQANEIKNIFIKQYLKPCYEQIKLADIDKKKELGILSSQLKKMLDETYDNFIVRFENNTNINLYQINPMLDDQSILIGKRHILNQVINDIIAYFNQFNFEIINSNEIVSTEYNFDALNIDKNHPARNLSDSFYLNNNYMLRTHCTSNTAQIIKNNHNYDIRSLSIGNVYRNDDDDATHSHQFMQVDLIWLNKDLNLSNLKYLIDGLLKHLFGKELLTRYRLSYFPFTEPSFEVDISCFICKGNGCSTCKNTGWIEVLGAGMLNINVIKYANLDNNLKGLAAGIGIDRVAMLKYGISDIRDLYNNNLKINSQF